MALTAVVLLAATAAAALGTSSVPLALAITPAVIDSEATSAGPLPVISLSNQSNVGFRLTVFPALAGQAIDGGLTLLRGARNDAVARRMLRLAAPSVVGPGTTVKVRPFFLSFTGRRSVSVAAVIVAVPLKQPRRGVIYRLSFLAALFVHRPQAATRPPTIGWVRATRISPRRTQFTVRVRNPGETPAFITSVRLRVLNRQGRVLGSVAARPGFLLPHSIRNFRAELFHRFPAGRLRAEALVRSGARETRRSAFFAFR